MFHKEFFPTPQDVLMQMQIDCRNKVALEPQAGKCDIVDFLFNNGAKEVLTYEINKDLQHIVKSKSNFLGEDFFNCKAEDVSHVDLIVMNPPFSNADKHIEHAFEIAPEGCEIISLCNYETISKDYRYYKLNKLISNYGLTEDLGNCFDTSERKTNVQVGLVKLFKPVISEGSCFDGFFLDEEEEEQVQENGTVSFNEVKALVNRHVGAVKTFDKLNAIKEELEYSTKILGISDITLNLGYNEKITTKTEFSKSIQKKSWSYIFNKMNLGKFVTSGVMKDINKFVETQQKYPFTEKNIYRMFDIIVGTRQQTFNRALEEAIDTFTKHTHENRFGVEGWKTNSGYMLNKKFIVECMVEPTWRDNSKLQLKSNSNRGKIVDLIKVMCNILGENFDTKTKIYDFFSGGIERGVWHEWDFFNIKVFKKGTMHLKFKNLDHWYRLNKAYGELKGFTLSENYN